MRSSSDNSSSSNDDEGGPPNKAVPVAVVMGRRRFSMQQRMNLIWTVARLMQQEGMCRVEACRDVNIHPSSMHLKWMKHAQTMIERKRMNVRARSTHVGCIGCLAKYTEELLSFIFKLREKGMGVTVPMVVTKASQMSDVFRNKSTPAKYHSARRFIRSHGLMLCIGTNESQRSPQEIAAEALDFIVHVVLPKVLTTTTHQDFVLNMDQTPVPFTYNARKMLEIVGRHTVHTIRHAWTPALRAWVDTASRAAVLPGGCTLTLISSAGDPSIPLNSWQH